jgi:hypothetical protein
MGFRYIIVGLIFSLFAYTSVKAQEYKSLSLFNKDTVAYLKYNFADQSGKYENRPISKLLGDLEIPIIYFLPIHNFDNKRFSMEELVFEFNSRKDRMSAIRKHKDNLARLVIRFSPPVKASKVDSIISKRSNNSWYDEINEVYSKCIITKIIVN